MGDANFNHGRGLRHLYVHHRRTGGFEEGLAFFRSQVGRRSSSTHTAYSYQPYIWEFCACFHFAFPLLVFCIISHPHLFVTKSTEGVFRARVVRCEHQSTRPGCAHRGVGFRARCVSLGPHTAGRTKAAATAPEDVDWASDSMSDAAHPHHCITTVSPVYNYRITTASHRYFLYLERF